MPSSEQLADFNIPNNPPNCTNNISQLEPDSENTKVVLITNPNVDCKIDRIEVIPDSTGRTFNVFLDVLPSPEELITIKKENTSCSECFDLDQRWKQRSHFPQQSILKYRPTRRTLELANPRLESDNNTRISKISKNALHYSATPRIQQLARPIDDKSTDLNVFNVTIPRRVLEYKATPRIIQLAQPKSIFSDSSDFFSHLKKSKRRQFSSSVNTKDTRPSENYYSKILHRDLPKEIVSRDNQEENIMLSKKVGISNRRFIALIKNEFR